MLSSPPKISIFSFTFLILFSHHILAQPSESLTDAITDGRAPSCSLDYGRPSLSECSDALTNFISIIQDRGFALDQTIEFLGWGIDPLHADVYPRQPIEPGSYTFSSPDYHSDNDNDKICIIQYGMEEPPLSFTPSNDPSPTYPSALTTHNDFLASTRLLLGLCVGSGLVGGTMKIRGVRGRAIIVRISNSLREDWAPILDESTLYKSAASDKELFKGSTRAVGSSWPWFGDPGQGSSTGTGQGRDGEWWIRYCSMGVTAAAGECAINQVCERVQVKKEEVMWGAAINSLLKIAGECVDVGQATASSASFWSRRRWIL